MSFIKYSICSHRFLLLYLIVGSFIYIVNGHLAYGEVREHIMMSNSNSETRTIKKRGRIHKSYSEH